MTLTPSEKALIRTFIRHAQTSVADLSALLADDENPDTEVGHPASMLPPEATLQRTVLTALEDSEVGLRVSEISQARPVAPSIRRTSTPPCASWKSGDWWSVYQALRRPGGGGRPSGDPGRTGQTIGAP